MTGRRFRGEADMDGQADSAEPDAFDPSATSPDSDIGIYGTW